MQEDGITADDLEIVAFYDKPFLKFERILETYLSFAPKGISSFLKAMPLWIKKKLWIKTLIQDEIGFKGKILFPEHHAHMLHPHFMLLLFRMLHFLLWMELGNGRLLVMEQGMVTQWRF